MIEPAKAEARKIEALAEARKEELAAQGAGEADAVRLRGMAEAETMVAKAGAWGQYNEAAIADRLLAILPELAAAVSAPLAKTEKIVMIGGGNGDGVGAHKVTRDVTKIVAELPEVLEALTGKKLDELVKALPKTGDDEPRPSAGSRSMAGRERADEAATRSASTRTTAETEPRHVLAMAREHGVRMVDFKFTDLPGTWQHISLLDPRRSTRTSFEEGLGFDGSSIRGFQEISESDMILVPAALDGGDRPVPRAADDVDDLQRLRPDHARAVLTRPALRGAEGRGLPARDRHRRHLLHGAGGRVLRLRPRGLRPAGQPRASTRSTPQQGFWNRGAGLGEGRMNGDGGNLGLHAAPAGGLLRRRPVRHPLGPARAHGRRARGHGRSPCEFHHHEVSAGGQAEIDLRFDKLLRMGDKLQTYKYVIKNVAYQAGKSATFMPKPLFEENGSGMHVHQSLFTGDENVMYDFNGYGQLSREALNYIGGILRHGRALMAFCAPTTNSLPAPDAGLRGAREPLLLAAQPLGGLPDPGLLARSRRRSASSSGRRTRPRTPTSPSRR